MAKIERIWLDKRILKNIKITWLGVCNLMKKKNIVVVMEFNFNWAKTCGMLREMKYFYLI